MVDLGWWQVGYQKKVNLFFEKKAIKEQKYVLE